MSPLPLVSDQSGLPLFVVGLDFTTCTATHNPTKPRSTEIPPLTSAAEA
jgi:hypothetical protein